MKEFLYSQRWWILGSVFAGLSMACASRQGEIEYAAEHVWQEADRLNSGDDLITPEDKLHKPE
jgi:hypothetical protein